MAGRNVRQGFNTTPADFYFAIPPLTRLWATAALACTVAVEFGLLSPYSLLIHWPSVFKLQVWRLVSNFLFLGGFSMKTIIQIIWIITYSKPLEASTYQFNLADYVYMLLFGMVVMLGISTLVPFLYMPFLSTSLIFMVLYVWSREFTSNTVSIWGLVEVQAFYLPFAFMVLNVLLGGSWKPDVLGIVVGHLYHFLKVLHPAAGGADLLKTPAFLTRVQQSGFGNPAVRPAAPTRQQPGAAAAPAAPTGFRAFGGTGRRLAD